jgi:hypothetical protein
MDRSLSKWCNFSEKTFFTTKFIEAHRNKITSWSWVTVRSRITMEFIEKDINGKITSNLRRGKYSFFEEDNENNEKSISSIHTGTKLTWIKIYFKINYDYKLWSDINFLRNKASHSSKITEQEKLRLEILQLNFQINQRDFFSFLNKFVKNLESKL